MASLRSYIASSSRSAVSVVGAARSFASSSRLRLPETEPVTSTPSSTPAASASASASASSSRPVGKQATFGSLFGVLQAENPLTLPPAGSSGSTPASSPSAHTPERAQTVRGYELDALPPNVDPMLDLFTNLLMKHGKKAEAQRRVSNILSMLQQTANQPPLPLLHRAIHLSSPYLRVMSTRRRAKVVLTPMALDERQRTRQGIQWLLKAAEKGRKGGIPREQRIAKEVFSVLEGASDVFKWIEERHKVATANRSNIKSR